MDDIKDDALIRVDGSEHALDGPVVVEGVIDEPPPPPPNKFMCMGAKRDPPACSYKAPERWLGRCPGCHRYYDCVRIGRNNSETRKRFSMAALATGKKIHFRKTHIPELDAVLGQTLEGEPGGLVDGSFYLIGGTKGSGKTTLLLSMCDKFATPENPVLYTSGEMTVEQIGFFVQRIGLSNPNVYVRAMESIPEIEQEAKELNARLIIVDSIQTCSFPDIKADTGTASQIDAAAQFFDSFANDTGKIFFVIGHLTKLGELAGTEKLQHLVDALFYLELAPTIDAFGDVVEGTQDVVRLSIYDGKNRYGNKNAEAFFEKDDFGRLVSMKSSTLKRRLAAEQERQEMLKEAQKVVEIGNDNGKKRRW